MYKFQFDKMFGRSLFSKNWEAKIHNVYVKACDLKDDPLGFQAVYQLKGTYETFVIGASLLAQRERNLTSAGYKVPMTQRAIALIEQKLGTVLPEKVEGLARAV